MSCRLSVLGDLWCENRKSCADITAAACPAWRHLPLVQQTFEKFCSLEYWHICLQKIQEADMAGLLQCEDLMHFQRCWTDIRKVAWKQLMVIFRALKQLRAIDDKIIYALNVSTPTASMQVEHDKRFRGNPKEWVKHIAFQNERMGPLNQCFRFLLLDD